MSIGNFPLCRAKRKTQNMDSVKADMKSGRTYDLINVIEMPPEIATVVRNSTTPAVIVANIEIMTILCSLANVQR